MRPTTLVDVQDVAESLRLEVCGTISSDDGPQTARSDRRQLRLARYVMLASEITLASAVVLLVLVSIADRNFAGHLVENPFSAYSYAVHWIAGKLVL